MLFLLGICFFWQSKQLSWLNTQQCCFCIVMTTCKGHVDLTAIVLETTNQSQSQPFESNKQMFDESWGRAKNWRRHATRQISSTTKAICQRNCWPGHCNHKKIVVKQPFWTHCCSLLQCESWKESLCLLLKCNWESIVTCFAHSVAIVHALALFWALHFHCSFSSHCQISVSFSNDPDSHFVLCLVLFCHKQAFWVQFLELFFINSLQVNAWNDCFINVVDIWFEALLESLSFDISWSQLSETHLHFCLQCVWNYIAHTGLANMSMSMFGDEKTRTLWATSTLQAQKNAKDVTEHQLEKIEGKL